MLTVSALVDTFNRYQLAEVKAGIAQASTAAWYRHQLDPLKGKLGFISAADLRPHLVVEIRYTNAFIRACKRLSKWGADEGLLASDYLRKLKLPPCGQRDRVLTRSEFVRLLVKLPRRHRWPLLIMRRTIARPGEIRCLQWKDVDLEDRLIVLSEFKGKKSRRDGVKQRAIPLDAFTLRALKRWSDHRLPAGGDHVFGGERAIKANCLSLAVRRARRSAGLSDDVVPYTARHTAATTAIENGVSLSHVAGIMGHARTSTTERYVHLNAKHLVAVIDQATARPRLKLVG